MPRLQPFDVINARKNLVLQHHVVPRIHRRITDDRHIVAAKFSRVLGHQFERRDGRVETIDDQDRHVPVRVNHRHVTDGQRGCVVPLIFLFKIDLNGRVTGQPYPVGSDAAAKQRRDVTVGQ